MNNLCKVNNESNKIIISFGPKNVSECNNWYNENYRKSIKFYCDIIRKLSDIDAGLKIFILSYYRFNNVPNVLEKKKGMRGIFSKFGVEYNNNIEKFISDKEIISVVENQFNETEYLFVSQINSLLCIGKNITPLSLLNNAASSNLKDIENDLNKEGCITVSFNDTGCDGNSITICSEKNIKQVNSLINEIKNTVLN